MKRYHQKTIRLNPGVINLSFIFIIGLIFFLIATVIILSRSNGITILNTRASNETPEAESQNLYLDAEFEALCGPGQTTRYTKTFLSKTNLQDKVVLVDLKIAPIKKSYAVTFAKVTITFDNQKLKLRKRVNLKYFEKTVFRTSPEEANQTGKIVLVGTIGTTQRPITTSTSIAALQFERVAPNIVTSELIIKAAETEIITTPAQTAENTVSSLTLTF